MTAFDYIVVGAGSAGCALANRLTEDARTTVLLLEAGGSDRSPFIRVPVGMLQIRARDAWQYPAEPDGSRGGARDIWAGGKVLGGSSSVNGQVWTRGDPADFDEWAALGAKGWDYSSVLPYFKRIETFEGGEDEYRGAHGPLHVSWSGMQHRLTDAFVEAAQQAGHAFNPDLNGARQEGVGYAQVSQRRGWRHSTARAYLAPAHRRSNLAVVTHAVASRVVIDAGRATGVEYRTGRSVTRAEARRGVVLCAGAIESPKLLMLSGIGPREELRALGIDVVADLPGVGRNLQEHPIGSLAFGVSVPTLNMELNASSVVRHGLDFLLHGRGAASAPPTFAFVFGRLAEDHRRQDYEINFAPFGLAPATKQGGPALLHGRLAPMKTPVIRLGVWSCHPGSRGTVTLRSSAPEDLPIIRHEVLGDRRDIAVLTAAARRVREIVAAPALGSYVTEELAPGPAVDTDDEWDAHFRRSSSRGFHQIGTCRTGTDADAVVDPELRVRGIEGLHVADASVMPTLVSGHTNAAAVMIGERAADFLRGRT